MTVRVRIAPSPTGSIHVGLARTALYNALFARKHAGTFVLRIEDTDEKRNLEESERQIYDGLRWLGIPWDEGPDKGGPFGPYRQSERTALYRAYLEQLLSEGRIYPCYCTQAELKQERLTQERSGQPPIYAGRCRTATTEHVAAWKAEGRIPIFRFATRHETIAFDDIVRGHVVFRADHLGDFSVARDLDHPLFNFAVAVDDALMHISHVIRGEEHLSNTPKNILVLQALQLAVPTYAHLPLLLAPDRKKLSKRDGATAVHEYREQGFLPEALLNFLALLGWHPKDEREQFTFDELVQVLALNDVQKAGAIFDRKKLESMNAQYIRALPTESILRRAGTLLAPLMNVVSRATLIAAVRLVQGRLITLRDLPQALGFLLDAAPYEPALLIPKKGTLAETRAALATIRDFLNSLDDLPENPLVLKERTLAFLAQEHVTTAQALWPLRVALTGQAFSPDVFDLAAVLGKKEVLRRTDKALENLAHIAEP